MTRIPFDSYFMEMATLASTRATCDRLHVGCVLVKENRILATGYNGAPHGLPHCDEAGHLMKGNNCVRTVHAEENALLQAASTGTAVKGATAYVTHEPCLYCTRHLMQAGIERVVFIHPYPNDFNHHFIGNMQWEHMEVK